MPKPKAGEKEGDYVSRCMSTMAKDHPDWDQKRRAAACYSMYERKARRTELWLQLRKALESIESQYTGRW